MIRCIRGLSNVSFVPRSSKMRGICSDLMLTHTASKELQRRLLVLSGVCRVDSQSCPGILRELNLCEFVEENMPLDRLLPRTSRLTDTISQVAISGQNMHRVAWQDSRRMSLKTCGLLQRGGG